MLTEFEATFIDYEKQDLRDRLKKAGAKLIQPERLMRRANFNPPKTGDIETACWLRVRDEGNKITMSIKEVAGIKINDQKENCLEINDFEQGVEFLKNLNCKQKSYQETKRESWELNGTELEIDTWPGLESFLEIEGQSEDEVKKVAEKLGLDYNKAIFGAVDLIYQKKLNIPPEVINNHTPELTFENPPKKNEK